MALAAGCLPSGRGPPRDALRDREMMNVIERSAFGAIAGLEHPLKRLFWFFRAKGDPNDWRTGAAQRLWHSLRSANDRSRAPESVAESGF